MMMMMMMMMMPIAIEAFRAMLKGLEREWDKLKIRGRFETVSCTALFKSARILRRVLVTKKTCCHSNSSERPSADACVKNLH